MEEEAADAKPVNLSFNLQSYIGHFTDRHILFAHDPRVSKKKSVSGFETRPGGAERFFFLRLLNLH